MASKLFTFYVCLLLSQFSTLVVSQWIGNQGEWQLLHESIGISAMHMQLLHNNKVVMFDRTDFGTSNLSLPLGRCRFDSSDVILKRDCSAHSIMYDIGTNTFRPLMVQTDTWCSSGAVLQNGTLVQTGGYNDGDHVIRTIDPCGDWSCDWHEFPGYLSQRRWYATNQILPDGRIIIVGGRRQFNYEFYPRSGRGWSQFYLLNFLRETNDESENNLYPFVHLLPDGNLFIFANTRSIAFDYKNNRVIKEFPSIVGDDPRNYPSSGSSIMLPIDENENKMGKIVAEIMVCGGAPRKAFPSALQGTFVKAISSCGRLKISDENPSWVMETMPLSRVMGDMLLLPNDDVIIVNGAASGTAGWENARNPVTRPVIYHPNGDESSRFSVMQATIRPRLYHSTAILLTDGRVLVGGSNPHVFYNFSNVDYPTDLSLEAFLPPYLAEIHDELRPTIVSIDEVMGYNQSFTIVFRVPKFLRKAIVSAKIIAPSFTTHSFAMNQRTVVLRLVELLPIYPNVIRLSVVGPSTREIAPPGYYLLFVVHSGVPSSALWVKVQ